MDIAIAHLPPQTPIIPFTTREEVTARAEVHSNALLDSLLKNQYLIFTNVPQSAMDYWCWSDKGVLKSGRFNYSKSSRIMVLKITKSDILNEVLCAWEHVWNRKEVMMGLHDLWDEGEEGYYIFHGDRAQMIFGDMIKQSDRYYNAGRALGGGLESGCNVVWEVGLAGVAGSLDFDAVRWLQAGGKHVGMVIVMVVWDDVERLVVKTWENVSVSVTTGTGTGTGAGTGKEEIQCTQEVVIRRRNGKTVSSGFLRFPFKRIFGRDPDPTKPVDQDIILEEKDLERIASRAWWRRFGKDVDED